MINTHQFELRLSRTYIYGSKGGRAIEILLYVAFSRLEFSFFYLNHCMRNRNFFEDEYFEFATFVTFASLRICALIIFAEGVPFMQCDVHPSRTI